ncbi:putative reverse transcriptase, RNA-dependent DNA polymerase [Tanacetum coccineum]
MNQDISRRTVNVEKTSFKSMLAIDGAGFDWSYMADDEVPTNMALMDFLDSEEFQQPEFEGYGPKTSKNVSEDTSNEVRKSPDALMVEKLVSDDKIEKKTIFPSIAKIEFVRAKQHEKPVRKSVKPKAVNTARPNSTLVNTVRANQVNAVKASTCWVWRPTKLNSASITLKRHNYVDARGRSKHMTGNMSYLSDFKKFDGGYVTFGKGAKRGKNTVKGTLKTSKLDFEDVYFVKELQFNLFSFSQMCDKKNNVLFTDTRCFVLSPDIKLMNKKYYLVVIDDYSRFTWIFFLASKDETSGILKSFITEIENLVDKKVKIIRCDNGAEFKNRVMSDFCEKKGIKREFSIARTPQQNSVVKRRNRILIEAARTMLADSKLPTTFWAEAVNTACYVQNKCHVTILNTLDYLGKFDGKSDEGFFIGYSLNSKAFRVYNIITRKVKESFHIRFLEDKPIIAGDGPKWLFDIDVLTKSMNYVTVVAGTNSNNSVSTEESVSTGHSSKETGSSQDYILMPLWKDGSLFDSSSKNTSNDEPQPSSDAEKKDDEGVNKASGIDDQERPKNSTQDVNTAGLSINTGSTNVNTGSLNINTVSPIVTIVPLKATHANFFGNEIELYMSNITTTYLVPTTPNTRIYKDHSLDHVIGDVQSGVQTRRMTKTLNEQGFINTIYEGKTNKDLYTCLFACFLSQEEPKKVIQALKDPSWIEAMQEELMQFKLQQVWTLVELPHGKRAIGTKWVYKNKKDERGIVIKNKVRVVAQGYTQEEGIDYDEVFAPVARIEAIRLFLAYASFKDFVVYQMDVNSAFLYGKIKEVYVYQPLGFEDPEFPDNVYKVEKELYGLHQSPRAWYETLSTYLLDNGFQRGQIDKTLFIKRVKSDILLVQVYVDDIIFGSTKRELCTNQDKYVDEILKKFGFSTVKTTSTPMETSKLLLKDAEAEDVDIPNSLFDLEAYTDSDYAGASLDRKSTTGAEYVVVASCCGQILWIKNQMLDYGYNFMNTKIFIDNEITICIVKNLVFHLETKHIEIRHHFIRDSNGKKLIQMIKIHTYQNVADLLTKAFDVGRFQYLIASIGMLNL